MRMNSYRVLILSLGCFVLAAASAPAEVKLPALISNNMVLQQGKKAPIWGTAEPGESVTVTLKDQKVATTADGQGRWKVELDPLKAGGPFEMTIAGTNTITLRDILVGEIWIGSGQSNMEMAVGPKSPQGRGGVLNAEQEIAAANYPMIRLFTVNKTVAGQPQQETQGQWVMTSPQSVRDFSAVGYFFGRELHKTLGVPIGVIQAAWGGTPAEAWTSQAGLESDPELKPVLVRWQESVTNYPKALEQFVQQFEHWKEAARKAEAEGKPAPAPPVVPPDPRSNSWRASGLFNAMIAPLIPYAIQGVIWYQGESNADRAYQYRKLFPAMIRDWRRAWGQDDFPFLFVQLANFQSNDPRFVQWPELREAQLMTLSLPRTGMAVTVDIGDSHDIHPKNKQDVGRRLALAALAIAYGRDGMYSGPIYKSMNVEGAKIRLRFDHVNGGLMAKGGRLLKGFEIAGENHRFVPAEAKIEGDSVVVRSDKVAHPVAVRYAWAIDPVCNLYNRAGLPATPFRTDDWQEVTAERR